MHVSTLSKGDPRNDGIVNWPDFYMSNESSQLFQVIVKSRGWLRIKRLLHTQIKHSVYWLNQPASQPAIQSVRQATDRPNQPKQ